MAEMAVKLRQLQYFLAAAETLQFTKAAEQLFITQPTLSHQIAQLEGTIGMPLFDRIGKSVRLTEAGRLFKTYAARALKELEAGQTALAELDGLVRGTLIIGVIQSFSRTLLPPVLGEFLGRYPNIRLRVEEMTAPGIEHRLVEGALDLGIAFAPSMMEDTEVEPILEERLLLVVGRDHPLAQRRTVRLAELDRRPMALLGAEFSTRRLIDRYFAEAGAQPDVICETNSIEVMLGAVMQSRLATIIPEKALSGDKGANIRVLPLGSPTPVRTSALLWPRHRFRTLAARTFAGMIRERILARPAED
jgi:LysR family transcriptional regulator, cyn operon transcriptional activator